jgi:hypothetical protein
MSRGERSSKLLEYSALTNRVLGVLVDGAGVVEVTPAIPTIWCVGSRFDLHLALHVAGRYMSCILQAKSHAEDDDGVLRGHLTHSQTLIVSEIMPSTRSSTAIRSLGVGGWVFVSRSFPTC